MQPDANAAPNARPRRAVDEGYAEPIDFRSTGDIIGVMARAGTGRRQRLNGFASDYTDIIDYIIRSTHKMWEEGGIGLLYEHYAQNTVVWSDWGVNYGREQTMAYVIQRLAGFPDKRGHVEDVIWTGNDVEGFRTCHRGMQVAHNTGYSKYGPPTGRRVQMRSFANCVVRQNRVVEEWLVHDELAQVRQLGLDVDDVLRHLATLLDTEAVRDMVGEVPRVAGQTTPISSTPKHAGSFDVDDFVRQGLDAIWNWRLLNEIPSYYAPTCTIHAPSSREFRGHGAIRAFVLSILACFPDAWLQIDDLYWNGDGSRGYRTAVRWTLMGTHRGTGIYGRPTGKQIRILGTTQHRIEDGKIVEEWTLFNELALLWKLRDA